MEFPGPACYIAGAMDILASHATRHPDKPALIEGERVWSWAELVERRNRLGHALLELGLRPGEHVIFYAANSLAHSDAAAVFVSDQFLPVVEAVRAEARKVRHWILVGEARREWAVHLDDLLGAGRPEPG